MDKQSFVGSAARFLAARSKVDVAAITADADLLEAGVVDSFRLTELILFVEDATECVIDIDQFHLEHFRTLSNIYDNYVVRSR